MMDAEAFRRPVSKQTRLQKSQNRKPNIKTEK